MLSTMTLRQNSGVQSLDIPSRYRTCRHLHKPELQSLCNGAARQISAELTTLPGVLLVNPERSVRHRDVQANALNNEHF